MRGGFNVVFFWGEGGVELFSSQMGATRCSLVCIDVRKWEEVRMSLLSQSTRELAFRVEVEPT